MEQPEPEVKDRVLLYYAAGFNNLSGDLEEDIEELSSEGYVPQRTSGNVLLIFQNLAQGSYSNPVSPVLYRVYKDDSGNIVRNTLLTLEAGDIFLPCHRMAAGIRHYSQVHAGRKCLPSLYRQ